MRQRILSAALLAVLLACPVLAWGQNKLGLINLQEAIATTAEGKKAFTDIRKKFEPRQQDLQRLQQEIQALQDQLQKQQATLSDDERFRLSRELEDKSKLFKRAQEDATADFNQESQDTFRRFGRKMVRLLNDYAAQNGYALVLEAQELQAYFVTQGERPDRRAGEALRRGIPDGRRGGHPRDARSETRGSCPQAEVVDLLSTCRHRPQSRGRWPAVLSEAFPDRPPNAF